MMSGISPSTTTPSTKTQFQPPSAKPQRDTSILKNVLEEHYHKMPPDKVWADQAELLLYAWGGVAVLLKEELKEAFEDCKRHYLGSKNYNEKDPSKWEAAERGDREAFRTAARHAICECAKAHGNTQFVLDYVTHLEATIQKTKEVVELKRFEFISQEMRGWLYRSVKDFAKLYENFEDINAPYFEDVDACEKNGITLYFDSNKGKSTVHSSILISMHSMDGIERRLQTFPSYAPQSGAECVSATLIKPDIPITLYREEDGNKLGIVIDKNQLYVPHAGLICAQKAVIPDLIPKQGASVSDVFTGIDYEKESKYLGKMGRLVISDSPANDFVQLFETNYATWDIGEEQNGLYPNKKALTGKDPVTAVHSFEKALNRHYFKRKKEKTYQSRPPEQLNNMPYNELLVQQKGMVNPIHGIVVNISALNTENGKITSDENQRLKQIFMNHPDFQLYIYDKEKSGKQISVFENKIATALLNSPNVNAKLLAQ